MFSKLNLKNRYHKCELCKDSWSITTFSTHVGLFRHKRLNFGINLAAHVFQDAIRQAINNIPNVLNVSDDILVYGVTGAVHDKALEATLQCLSMCKLTLSPKKCSFFQEELTFFGHLFSSVGVRPDPKNVSALQDTGPSANVSDMRGVLGRFNNYVCFLPNLACLAQPLRQLTVKGTPWSWTNAEERTFDEIKD